MRRVILICSSQVLPFEQHFYFFAESLKKRATHKKNTIIINNTMVKYCIYCGR